MDTEFFYTRLAVDRAKARFQRTLEEYWHLDTHLRALEDTNFRVCLFGSARITAADPLYHTVFDLSHALAARGMDVITGGGPGLMEAANAGVRSAQHEQSRSHGLTLDELTRVADQGLYEAKRRGRSISLSIASDSPHTDSSALLPS